MNNEIVVKSEGERKKGKRGRPVGAGEGVKEKILQASLKVFAEYPYKAATTRQIAQEAGVDHPLIHYYFGSKEKLFELIVDNVYDELEKKLKSWLALVDMSSAKSAFSSYLDFVLDDLLVNPRPLQVVLINVVIEGSIKDLPGYRHIVDRGTKLVHIMRQRIPTGMDKDGLLWGVQAYNVLAINLIASKNLHAAMLGLDPDSTEYKAGIKMMFMALFLPLLEKSIGGFFGARKNVV